MLSSLTNCRQLKKSSRSGTAFVCEVEEEEVEEEEVEEEEVEDEEVEEAEGEVEGEVE